MSDILEKYAAARALFPDDIERIQAEEEQVKHTLRMREYATNPQTQELLGLARKQIVELRRNLATDRRLIEDQEAQLL